jgi:adenylosuccinate lyase
MALLHPLRAISPLDGRYLSQVAELGEYFSEFALIRTRLEVECAYYVALCRLPLPQLAGVPAEVQEYLLELPASFSIEDAEAVKAHEAITRHDVKALEYFMKERLSAQPFFEDRAKEGLLEFIHFGLTSQDVNNTANPLLLMRALSEVYIPQLKAVITQLKASALRWHALPMLARTHGQPASPTRLGKELMVFVVRLEAQLATLEQLPYPAKFGGATGNMNAHIVAYPGIDWGAFADGFVASLGLQRSHPTTQVEHYDGLAAIFDNLRRINVINIDLARDIWQYVSLGYFSQKVVAGEVGSSAMPHKVNPIDFENAEGNLGLANALLDHLSNKLPISRLQRDLTDSTVLRNVGVPVAHSLLALKSLAQGLAKLEVNAARLHHDLEANWAVVAEGIQTILRREGYPKPYEALKTLTRGEEITEQSIQQFIAGLAVSDAVKQELLAITPHTYTGNA